MNILRSRGPQDNPKAARHEPDSAAVPFPDTRRFPSTPAGPSHSFSFSNAVVQLCRVVYVYLRQPRRFSLLYAYRWLKRRRLLCCAVIMVFFVLLLTLLLISVLIIAFTWDHPWTQRLVQEHLAFFVADRFHACVPGASQPREPARLWGLTIAPAKPLVEPLSAYADKAAQTDYNARLTARLEAEYGESLFIYTFANGTERNHAYRRLSLGYCGPLIQSIEMQLALNGKVLDGKGTVETCTTPMQRAKTNAEVLVMVGGRAGASITGRDRETDELRHSMRSLEQHVRWHRGRVVVVSPGHHPTWVDGAKNFLAGACGDASVQALRSRGTHLRLTTVHQDAVMPANARLTFNTHVIEHQLWRVRNTTAVHVYMNDDYFVNRDVAITDLFNEYGGTIVRVESSLITNAYTAKDKMPSWAEGVIHTNYFNIRELDLTHEDDVAPSALQLWRQQSNDAVDLHADVIRTGAEPLPAFQGPSLNASMWTLLEELDEEVSGNVTIPTAYTKEKVMAAYANRTFGALRPRFFATHAPFVYCTNIHRYLAARYQREYALSMFLHRGRTATDLYTPFLYNAFVMARPWVASPRFPSYLVLQKYMEREIASRVEQLVGKTEKAGEAADAHLTARIQQARQQAVEEIKKTLSLDPIQLDNRDGCAPATMLVGEKVNGCIFGLFTNNLDQNELYMRQIARRNPMFFNVNAGFTTPKAADQLRNFIREKFPEPLYLETTSTPPSDTQAAMNALFDALMALPVVGVVSYDEGACPLVRSLSLAFAGHHRGRVHVRQPRHSLGEVDATLREVRDEFRYTPISALPTVGCTFSARVDVAVTKREESLAELSRQTLSSDEGRGVPLPWTCGAVDGQAVGGLRVRGFVIDARTPHAPIREVRAIPDALAVPGQTLALEDFRAVRVGPEDGDVVLVLARADAAAKAVHWINGASENDLLVSFPLPVETYENLNAAVKWVQWRP